MKKALKTVMGRTVTLHGAGQTDTGVRRCPMRILMLIMQFHLNGGHLFLTVCAQRYIIEPQLLSSAGMLAG